MRLYIFANFIVLSIYVCPIHGLPQSFDDPTKFFKYITYDPRHRGSLSITPCIKELINCWEFIKVDYVCSTGYYIFDSVCGVFYNLCDENDGFKDGDAVKLYEGFCRYH